MYILDAVLEKENLFITHAPVCDVLLMNNCLFPWLILVPRFFNVTELFELTEEQSNRLWQEVHQIGQWFKIVTKSHKINVAAYGNIVPQLHIHVIARFKDDAAWPNPVWCVDKKPYVAETAKATAETLKSLWKSD